jgi:DNA topoisomerase I
MTKIETLCARGITRSGSPKKGFRYQTADGKRLSRADLARINDLKIPPAWTDVCINASAGGTVQAVGKDGAGRWQYLYHETHVRRSEKKKFERLIEFAESLPALRRTVTKDLGQPGLARGRVMAGIMRILSSSFIRPGSQVYASENGSYGIATLRPKHVQVKGDTVIFDFPGKSGVKQHRELRDRRVAKLTRELLKHSAREVFAFQNGDDQLVDVKRRHINQYIKEVMGHNFSAKDFRTWAGTLICACALAQSAEDVNGHKTLRKRQWAAAIKETAEALGNTPAVCRKSYVCPLIWTRFEKGVVIDRRFRSIGDVINYRGAGLHPAEKALLKFLKKEATR